MVEGERAPQLLVSSGSFYSGVHFPFSAGSVLPVTFSGEFHLVIFQVEQLQIEKRVLWHISAMFILSLYNSFFEFWSKVFFRFNQLSSQHDGQRLRQTFSELFSVIFKVFPQTTRIQMIMAMAISRVLSRRTEREGVRVSSKSSPARLSAFGVNKLPSNSEISKWFEEVERLFTSIGLTI